MQRNRALLALLLLSALLVCALFSLRREKAPDPGAPAPERQSLNARAQALLARLSDEEKLGQLLIVGLPGKALDEESARLLSDVRPGGVILFDRNMQSPEQVAALNGALRERLLQTTGLPPFLCVDQEGGRVARLKTRLLALPAAETLGKASNPDDIRRLAADCAAELKAIGFNVNFAPVADLNLPGGRSYSGDPARVALCAEAACRGFADGGLLFSLKHFPGLGKAQKDPHFDGETIVASRSQLEREDLAPFAALIAALGPQPYFVMVSHPVYTAYDAENPASLSPAILRALLRQKLGFDGLAVTDDVEMGALANRYPFEEIGVRAVAAGADIVLVCHEPERQRAVYRGLLEALRSGALPRQTVDDAALRVIRAKLARLDAP